MKNFAGSLLVSVSAAALTLGAAGTARAAVIDYPASTQKNTPIVLTDNTTQLQVNTAPGGTAFQAGVISESGGSFGIEKIGAGTLALSAANTYTGVTTITGGVLMIGVNTGPTGSIASASVVDNGTFFFNRSNAVTFAGIVSGTGQVGIGGTGITTLSGVNTYTGLTYVNSGATLALSGAGSIAASSSVSLNGGALDISATTAGASVKALSGVAASNVFLGARALTITAATGNILGVISGTGGVTIAAGSQFLMGANTYTGVTTINAGASLALGNSNATTGSIASTTIVDNGSFSINRSNAVTIAGVISGTGAVSQAGTGTTTLTGANTYTGQTNINAGILALTRTGSISGSTVRLGSASSSFDTSQTLIGASIQSLAGVSGSVVSLGNTILTLSNANGEYDGSIRDGGLFIASGGSTLNIAGGKEILGGSNSYTNGTIIASGATLQVGNGGTTGAIFGRVMDNGTLIFSRSDAVTFAGAVSGTGALNKLSTGFLTLTGANTYTGGTTITQGILQIGSGGTIGSILGDVTDNGTLNFNRSDAVTFAGVISGTGVVAQAGAGTLTLTGVNTYTGSTNVNSGTLALTGGGSIAASSFAFVTATLDISGTTSGASIKGLNGAGTVALGTKTLTLTGTTSSATFMGAITGTGGLVVNGTFQGLSGTNTYTGGTTINSGGILTIGAGGTTGSIVGNVVDNGTRFGFRRSDAVTYAGVISGTGQFVQLGSGILTLSGVNTYSGATIVSAGTLNVTGSIASSAVTVTSAASLTGAGTVGATTISAGGILAPGNTAGAVDTLSVNGNLSLASTATTNVDVSPSAADKIAVTGTAAIAGTLNASFASGTFTPTQYALVTSTGALSGTFSSYNVTGLSTNFNSALSYNANNVFLVLSSAFSASSTANVNTGTVTVSGNQTTGGLASSSSGGTVAVTSGSTFTSNQDTNTVYSGAITGAGGFAKTGTGTLVLDGTNTYTGGTAVNGGTLEIGDAAHPNAAVQGPVSVGSGGTLQGHGTVNGAVTIGAGGTLQPGGTIGTITVGSATFASGSTYTVETNAAGQGNLTVATGAITINSGTALVVTPDAPLASYGRATTYTILQAGGGITGTFASTTSTAASLLPSLSYGSNAVSLTLIRPDLFLAVASTTNQRSVSTAIVAGGVSPLLATLAPQSDAGVQQGFNQLSGDIHASLRSAAVEDSRIIRDTVLDHLNAPAEGVVAWGAAFGGYGSIGTDGNASALHHNSAGFIGGADMAVGDGFRLGLAGAYSLNNSATTGHASTARGNSGHVVAYGGWSDGLIDLKAGGDFGWGRATVTRTVTAFAQSNSDRQDQQTNQVFGEAGYRFATERASVEPYIGIANVWAQTGAFAETGGNTALSGGERTDTQTYSTVGVRAAIAPMVDMAGIAPHVDLGWQHGFNTLQPSQRLTFQSLSQSFTVLGAPLASDAAALRFGFDVSLAGQGTLSLDYDGSFASRVQNNAIRGAFQWKF